MADDLRLTAVQHQPRAISLIRRALGSGRTHHAYLFEGPEGVGKMMAARALAARMLCRAELPADADACGSCASCRVMATGNHPDFHLIHRGLHKLHPDPAVRRSKGLFLAVDVVRHFLIDKASLSPTQGRARVFLVDGAERMNDQAQNALLKTLEEPPGHSRLILVTSTSARLLPTIRSRSQRVPFASLPTAFVEERLRSGGISAADARALARLSDGRLAAALTWARMDLLGASTRVRDALHTLLEARVSDPEGFARTLLQVAEELVSSAAGVQGDAEAESETDEDTTATESPEEPVAQPSGRRAPARGTGTDEGRAALKLALMLVADSFRQSLSGASLDRTPQNAQRRAASGEPGLPVAPEECIQAVVETEAMLDRNVPPQLACERLAAILAGHAALLT